MEERHYDYELVIVNDGSTDKTWHVMNEIQLVDPNFVPIHLEKNKGQSYAMMIGIQEAKGELITLLDADMQNDPKEIIKMMDKMEEGRYDIVCGWRKNRKDTYLTYILPSKICNFLIRIVFGIPVHDCGCGSKLATNEVMQKLKYFKNFHRYIPIMLSHEKVSMGEVVVQHRYRIRGDSKYSWTKMFSVFFELLFLKFQYKTMEEKPLDLEY